MREHQTPVRYRVTAVLLGIVLVTTAAAQQTRESAKTGAGWGALAGLVFGGDLGDVIEGAVVGGVAGSVVGSSKGREQQAAEQTRIARAAEIREQEKAAYEKEAQRKAMAQAEYEQRLRMDRERLELAQATAAANQAAAASQTAATAPQAPAVDDAMLKRAFGEDTVVGWYALKECKHNNALIAATAGENSSVASHQLAAVWLRAIIALDRKQANSAQATFQNLVEIDPEVQTVADAQMWSQDLLVDLRADRKTAGISCK